MTVAMRRKELERTDSAFIVDVLTRAEDMYVAFSTDAAPYLIPLNYVYAQEKLYFHSAVDGRKLDCLRKNNQVGFSTAVDVCVIPEKATTIFKSVVGSGRMSVVEDVQEKIFALDALSKRYGSSCPSPATEGMLKHTAVLCLEIEYICGKEKFDKVES